MTKLRLTKTVVQGLKAPDPSGKQKLYRDTELTGFAVLCSGKTKEKTFVVRRSVGNADHSHTVGPANVLTLEQAREKAKGILALLYAGKDPKAAKRGTGKLTLQDWLDEYLTVRTGLSARSQTDYRKVIENNLTAWLSKPLPMIKPEMVEVRHRELKTEVLDKLAERAKKTAERAKKRHAASDHLTPTLDAKVKVTGESTANGAMRALSVIWNFAADRVELPANPVKRLKKQWFKVERRTRLVRSEDLPAFYAAIQALPNDVARDYLTFLMFTGLRRNEAAALQWTDVDFKVRAIRIPASRTKSKRKLDLPMTDTVHSLLVARQNDEAARQNEQNALVEPVVGRKFVFPANGKSGHISEPKFPLSVVREATGIHVSAHDLRRTYITVAASTDISPYALKALVNHSLGDDVTAGYVVFTTEHLRAPAQRVAEKMKALCGLRAAPEANVVPLVA